MDTRQTILLSSKTTKLLHPSQTSKASNTSNILARGMYLSSANKGLKFTYSSHIAQLAEVTEQDQKEKKLDEKRWSMK